jgi:exodeoxyribonuclease VII small subunit
MPTKHRSYKQLSEELANIIAWFEGGDIDLDEAVGKYEKAEVIMKLMQDHLRTAENKIKKISASSK